MTTKRNLSGSELFIVDNGDQDWKVLRYLHDWCQLSKRMDVATGYFEIGALLGLKDEWQKVDEIRILMGDEVSRRTQRAFEQSLGGITEKLDLSLESEKDENDFLVGVPAIVQAIRSGKIKCRVYRTKKFHAKAYITHGRLEVIGASALVGSSNFTVPGLTQNIELNVQITGRPVSTLQEWFDEHWEQAEDVSPDVLTTIERHTAEYTPFDVYAKALYEFFRGHAMTAGEWEHAGGGNGGSKVFSVLDQYQKDGYAALMSIANRYGGALLCDGVGLGKTFVGLMVIERLVVHDRKRVVLLVPKAGRVDVWERALRKYLSHVGGVAGGDFSNLVIYNHTDLSREGDFPERFKRLAEMADAVVIDEAHHFRNPGPKGTEEGSKPSRYRQLAEMLWGGNSPKQVFMLTATPINNRLHDLRHMIELFTGADDAHFKDSLGIHSLRGHFIKMERALRRELQETEDGVAPDELEPIQTHMAEAEQVLTDSDLFRALVVQRSRSYVKRSQEALGVMAAIFPERQPPAVASYSVKKTYGRVLDMLEQAFEKEKPLFVLGIYYPWAYFKGASEEVDQWAANRQKEVVGLIRVQFLKRFESSVRAFEASCENLLLKLLAWACRHSETPAEKRHLERWTTKHAGLLDVVRSHTADPQEEQEGDEDIVTEEMLEAVEYLPREEYSVEDILVDTFDDLNQLAEFLAELARFKPQNDDKLQCLLELLKADPVLSTEKVLVFSEFAETARYLKRELVAAGISGVEQIDSGTKGDRSDIIRRFAPYYNGSSSREVTEAGKNEIRVLISTDVLSEGLNLQDATRLINFDIHWNPVRLMQRIGRVDRRMNLETEAEILKDHPEQVAIRGRIAFWNFLPPEELERLLKLFKRVSGKTKRISKTFGIEGKKLFRPDDDYDALREFNQAYEGRTTPAEEMRLELQKLLSENPGLEARLDRFPLRVFSGKEHTKPGARAVFFCYSLPKPSVSVKADEDPAARWASGDAEATWYLYDLETGDIVDDATRIAEHVRSTLETPRRCFVESVALVDARKKVERHIKNTYLKKMQAPIGVKPTLKAWLELN